MKRTFFITALLLVSCVSAALGMGSKKQSGVIIFFKKEKIVLKTNETRLKDICDAVENLTGVKIIVDDVLFYKNVTVDMTRDSVEDLLVSIVKEIPAARYVKILKSEEVKVLEHFIIFKKARDSEEVATEFISKKRGLQEAFVAKHGVIRVSGKLSVSGMLKLNGVFPYDLPRDISKFAGHFIEENKSLLNLNDVNLGRERIGSDYISYKQYYNGVMIDNLRSYAFQIKYIEKDDGRYVMISNNTIPDVNTSVQPKITEKEAVELVIEEIRKAEKNSKLFTKGDVIPESIELKLLPQLDIETDKIIEKFKNMSLYWSVNIDFYSYYVDAKTGKVYKDKSL